MATQEHTGTHVLPAWFEWFQDNVVLTLLVIAGMILNGLMFTEGIVPQGDITHWGFLPTVKVVAFFLAGSGLTGVALRAGAMLAKAFREGRVLEALVMLAISLLFIPLEIWASVTVRSLERVFTPADTWVMQAIGQPNLPVSPTIVVIAIASPLILFTWGIVTRKATVETHEEQAARQAREEAEAAHKAKLAQYQGAGFGARIGAGIKAAKAQVSGSDTAGYDEGKPTGSDDPNHGVADSDTAGYDSASGQAGYGAKAPVSIRKGQWTSRDLMDYAKREYGADVGDIPARRAMSVLSNGNKKGNSYVAPMKTVKAWVDRNYSAGNGDAEPTGTGER